jgi:hypothetical protein
MPDTCLCHTELVLGAQYNVGHISMFENKNTPGIIAIQCNLSKSFRFRKKKKHNLLLGIDPDSDNH